MRWYMFDADAGYLDGAEQSDGGLSTGALEGPALAGQRAGPDHGARAETLAAEERGQHVQRPAHRRLVDHVLQSISSIQYSCSS